MNAVTGKARHDFTAAGIEDPFADGVSDLMLVRVTRSAELHGIHTQKKRSAPAMSDMACVATEPVPVTDISAGFP